MMSRAKSKDQRTPQISLDSPPLSPSATKRSLPHTCVSPGRAESVRCKKESPLKKKQLPRTPEQSPYIRRRRKERIDGMQPKSKSCQRNIEKLFPINYCLVASRGETRRKPKTYCIKGNPRDRRFQSRTPCFICTLKLERSSALWSGSGGPIYGEITTKVFNAYSNS